MMLEERVEQAVALAPVVDLHTHLFSPQFEALNLWGVDEILTYHYLVAETLRARPSTSPEEFFARSKAEQADFVWKTLFVERPPLSEATLGVLTIFRAFGIDPAAPDLRDARACFAIRRFETHLEEVFELAGVRTVVMTNDPTDPAERGYWDRGVESDLRFLTALRIDRMIHLPNLSEELDRWIDIMQPRYLAISLTEVQGLPTAIFEACRKHRLPFAMMIGVNRAVNPRLGAAGDGVITADLEPLADLAREYPDLRFLVTTLARENTHPLCVLARKFANILPFGCWWFMNNPSLVEETTRMRLEMLGPTFVPQHSDARVLEHLIYKWDHSRRSIASALTHRYQDGQMMPTDAQIQSHVTALMSGIAEEWLA